MRIYLKNNCAEVHSSPICNDETLGFIEECRHNNNNNNNNTVNQTGRFNTLVAIHEVYNQPSRSIQPSTLCGIEK